MRAAIVEKFGGPEVLTITERDPTVLGPGDIRLGVEAIGVNRADLLARAGDYHRAGPPPLLLGLEAAGTVLEVGPDVHTVRVGQRVAAWGAINAPGFYATEAVVSATNTVALTGDISSVVAAALPTAWLSAWYCLRKLGKVDVGKTVVIHAAASGVGSAAVQIARDAGAEVIALVSSADKAAWVSDLGAQHVINTSQVDRDGVLAAINTATSARGADIVLDTVGGPAFEQSLAMAAFAGTVVALANVALLPSHIDTRDFYPKNVQIRGFQLTALVEHGYDPTPDLQALMRGIGEGRFTVPIAATFDLEDAAAGHRLLGDRSTKGKVILTVS